MVVAEKINLYFVSDVRLSYGRRSGRPYDHLTGCKPDQSVAIFSSI